MTVIEVGADLAESALYVIFLDLFNMRRLKGKKADYLLASVLSYMSIVTYRMKVL